MSGHARRRATSRGRGHGPAPGIVVRSGHDARRTTDTKFMLYEQFCAAVASYQCDMRLGVHDYETCRPVVETEPPVDKDDDGHRVVLEIFFKSVTGLQSIKGLTAHLERELRTRVDLALELGDDTLELRLVARIWMPHDTAEQSDGVRAGARLALRLLALVALALAVWTCVSYVVGVLAPIGAALAAARNAYAAAGAAAPGAVPMAAAAAAAAAAGATRPNPHLL